MPIGAPIPDYELTERMEVTTPAQLRAMADPLRGTILDLLLERASTVAELAAAVERPKSTIAYARSRSGTTAGQPGCSTSAW